MHTLVHPSSSHVHHDDAGSNESHILGFVMPKLDFRVEQCSTTAEKMNFQEFWKKLIFRVPEKSGSILNHIFWEPEKGLHFIGFPKNLVQKWTRFFGNPKNLFFFSFVENSKISKQLNICDCKKPEGRLNCIGQSTHLFSEIVQYTVLPRVCMCMIPQRSCCKYDAACDNNCEC